MFCPNCNNSLTITQGGAKGEGKEVVLSNEILSVSTSSEPEKLPIVEKHIGKNNIAYMMCNNCGYAKSMEPGTLILSRMSGKEEIKYVADRNKYKDMVHDPTLPITRKYVCPNKECESHKNHEKREAMWFKPNRHTYVTIFICRSCETMW